MRFLRRFHPSPSMVVASAALLVALGGTSIAAVNALPNNSVGTPQLKGNAVITSKVKNRSLRAVDFAFGQLPRGPQGSQGLQGPAGPAGPAGVASPGYVAQVVSQTSTTSSTSNSLTYVDLADSSQTVTIPTGETGRLYASFTAESACYGGTGYCSVRIVVDGNEMSPASDIDFAFDSTNGGTETASSWESHAINRASDTLTAGAHVVKVQVRTTQAATNLRLDDWAFVVQRTKVS